MSDFVQRHDYVVHQLVALRDSYALSGLVAAGDPDRMRDLTDGYLRDATLVMSAAYGRACADQVRATAPRRRRRAADARGVWRKFLEVLAEAARRNAQEWHHQTLGLAGRW